MCLYIKTEFHPNLVPTTALADIVVYKLLQQSARGTPKRKSRFYDFEYWPHTMYRLRKALTPCGWSDHLIYNGFHSYLAKPVALRPFAYNYDGLCVCKFIIPKGAKYFIGTDGDIVSTSIISGNLRSLRTFHAK